MTWKSAAAVCLLLPAIVLSANANRWSGSNVERKIIAECARTLRKCSGAIVDGMKKTMVVKGRYLRKAHLLGQPALGLGEQVKQLLLDMNRTASSLQACQRDLTSLQSRLDGADKGSQAFVSRRGNQMLGAGLLVAAAASVIGYGVGYRTAPMTGKSAFVSGQPRRRSGIVSTVSTAIAGGGALKAFQSVTALKASRSSPAVMHQAGSPPDALVRPARDSSVATYVLAGVCATLIIVMVVSHLRFKRRLKNSQVTSVRCANCIQFHRI
ncbi:Uncharacterized protein PBTT_05066 [Plasmodiophora brassicae]